jgi:hypothetical protein
MSTAPIHHPDDDDGDDGDDIAALEVARARRDLPPRDQAMWDCFLGGLAQAVEPSSEADPLAVMASLITFAGVWLGPGPHLRAGDDRHPLLIWPLIIGRTSAGRKGASWGTARRLMHAADPDFTGSGGNVRSGLTSGEGLAQLFAINDDPENDQDGAGEPENRKGPGAGRLPPTTGGLPPGDVRLLVFEPEWAAVMARMRREGSSLSAMLRAAWEGGDLSTMNVQARHAPESHVGLLAHITPKEFAAKVSAADMAGGTYNRFLPLYVARSKFLPLSSGAEPDLVTELGAALAHRLTRGTHLGPIGFSPAGAQVWRRLYVEFGGDNGEDGPIEQFISRTAPNCLRIAAIHAALDGTDHMHPVHLHAAAALVRYSIASARAVFGTDPALAALTDWIAEAGPTGRTREEIRADYFHRHKPTAQIDELLNQLLDDQRITVGTRARADGKPGRAARIYTAEPCAVSAVSALRR